MYGHHFTNALALLGNECHKFLCGKSQHIPTGGTGILHLPGDAAHMVQPPGPQQTFGQPLTPAEGGSGVLTGPLRCQTSQRAGWVPKMIVQPRHLRQGWRGHDHRTEGVL